MPRSASRSRSRPSCRAARSLTAAVEHGTAFDAEAVRAKIRDAELAWVQRHECYPGEPHGDAIEVSRRLFAKYAADATVPEPPAPPPAS